MDENQSKPFKNQGGNPVMVHINTIYTYIVAICLAFLLVAMGTDTAFSQKRDNSSPRVSPNATVSQTIGTTRINITYGRPSVKGRDVFGGLQPYGEVWRTGANEATTITFSDDVTIEGEELNAGTYGLFTIPGEGEWTVIFNNVPNQWGAFDYDSNKDALRVSVQPEKGPHMEQLMFYFENVTQDSATCVIHWSDTKVPFSVTPDSE